MCYKARGQTKRKTTREEVLEKEGGRGSQRSKRGKEKDRVWRRKRVRTRRRTTRIEKESWSGGGEGRGRAG